MLFLLGQKKGENLEMTCDNWGIVPSLLLVINSFLDKRMKTSLMLKTPPVSFPELCKCLPPAHPSLGGFLNACVILPSLGWKHCEQKDEEKWRKKKEKQRLTQEAFPGLSSASDLSPISRLKVMSTSYFTSCSLSFSVSLSLITVSLTD